MMRIAFAASLAVMLASIAVSAKTVEEYLDEADALRKVGSVQAAYDLLSEALADNPQEASIEANLGLCQGILAGEAANAGNLPEAGNLTTEAFGHLDRGVELDPDNVTARLYRGLMAVNVPVFFGRLNQGLDDLEYLVEAHEKDPNSVPMDVLVQVHQLMATGYTNMADYSQAIASWEKVIELAPGTESAATAEESVAKLKAELAAKETEALASPQPVSPERAEQMINEAEALIETGKYAEAQSLMEELVASNPDNAEAHKQLAIAMLQPLEGGTLYDQRIHENTDWAINLAFNAMEHLDKAVELAPEDMMTRYLNGIMAVNAPFFVGKLDQGIEYLQMVAKSDLPEDIKAGAAYWLGYAFQKKGMSQWIELVDDHPEAEASAMALSAMRPEVEHFDPEEHARPVLGIEFVIAFRDELPPQSAVWIETPDGEFVRTLYVSGFSGNVKEVQMVLPVWASSTKFVGADAVTSASIVTGQHAFAWDLKDMAGNRVKNGRYVVRVEVHHWPSMRYQMVEGEIEIGDREARVVVQEGNYLPYLRLTYLP